MFFVQFQNIFPDIVQSVTFFRFPLCEYGVVNMNSKAAIQEISFRSVRINLCLFLQWFILNRAGFIFSFNDMVLYNPFV